MANKLYEESHIQNIADAIRYKNGATNKYTVSQMAEAIRNITGGSNEEIIELFPERTLSFDDMPGNYEVFGFSEATTLFLTEGKQYTVTLDGTSYFCMCKLMKDKYGDTIGLYLGNAHIIDQFSPEQGFENTGESFVIIEFLGSFAIYVNSDTDTHTVRICSGRDSNLVKYVTLMSEDGHIKLFVKPTIYRDNCVDVVAKGWLAAPTKDSTEQYDYTFSGWSLTPGGSTDQNALNDILEDRILYASFDASVRS